MNARRGERRRSGTPPGGSRLARRIPTLEDLRALLLAKHPECARVQAGGAPRLLPIAQVVCDWATPKGQKVVETYLAAARDPQQLARYQAARERMADAVFGRLRELDERALVARRAALKDAAAGLAAKWEAEDRAAALTARKEVAA
jgi:hypothetical protein